MSYQSEGSTRVSSSDYYEELQAKSATPESILADFYREKALKVRAAIATQELDMLNADTDAS